MLGHSRRLESPGWRNFGSPIEPMLGSVALTMRGPRSPLVSAAACALLGEDKEAASLERQADELRMEGFGWIMDTPRIRLGWRSTATTSTR